MVKAGALAAPPPEKSSPVAALSLAILSFSSRMIRWAIFLPMPGAAVRLFSSPVTMAMARDSGVEVDRMARAALGPTPETPISSLKLFSSFWVAKPYRPKAFSPTSR